VAENGRLPKSLLHPVAGEGELVEAAAAAWNALAAHVYGKLGIKLAPNGADSTYRTFERQVWWRNYWCGRGLCGNAAVPGTSNHGWGLAVDTDDSYYVGKYGAPFGFQKPWSDAPQEPWHFRYAAGHYDGPNPGPDYRPKPPRWYRRLGNRIEQARKRRLSKKRRRKFGDPTATRRALLHRQIQRLGRQIARWVKRRNEWEAKH
jgi:hypothetical protein